MTYKLEIIHIEIGNEQVVMTFNSELEMKNWLLDSGFKTYSKSPEGISYYRENDGTYAIHN